jgi:hypothetical protein
MQNRGISSRVKTGVVGLAIAAGIACLALVLAVEGGIPRFLSGVTPVHAASSPPIPEVSIVAHDYSFDMPNTIPTGLVRISMVNSGDDVHQAQFFRLLPGKTSQQFIDALLAGGPASTRDFGAPAGGTDETSPGLTTKVIIDLAAGNYVVACLVVSGGHPHYHIGMVGTFTAATLTVVHARQQPKEDGTITLAGMTVTLPDTLSKPGNRTFRVTNSGPGVHALDILQPLPGKTAADIEAYLRAPAGPPPFVYLGGMGGLAPSSSGWIETHLLPGDYVAACLVVDLVSHRTHASMGMMAAFTVV